MHLAAVADVDQVTKDPATADVVNVRCTQALLECVREQGTRRFVFASTIWVYGDASDPKPLEQIGQRLGLTRERVRQIEVEALKRLASVHEMKAAAYSG